ncbi:cuticular protein RR-1 motif 56 isoform X2 [Bombyx mori]|uniref:Putative cuticle protein n=1 Tax=Bombyx mori TaxID=7091 RepID=C0H6P8_BOMMO|nr:cuticular protein RR-1 motif 56 precursor [Bombyx mori]XP_012551893.1 cuticular protein RR-1 motif 56 isoform X1 [Bombyx mori]FAA00559.1 TPA: putative cuticle protein [Bombyx mori]
MLCHTLILVLAAGLTSCDVSHLETTTPDPPPKPYVFSYTAGRFPGHVDREHTEVSDGSGVVRGKFAYVDPRHKVRTVDYVADKEGFHPILSDVPPEHPADSESVALAKDRHFQLYSKIAEEHAQHPHPYETSVPRQSAAVAEATLKHSELFRVIAEQHARIAAEREALIREEEEKQHLQELEQ